MILLATDRVTPLPDTMLEGRIVWDAPNSLWWFAHATGPSPPSPCSPPGTPLPSWSP